MWLQDLTLRLERRVWVLAPQQLHLCSRQPRQRASATALAVPRP